jgi:hypothetical protein
MGSLSGRDNFSGREVANSASKFGLRGVVHSLREELRSQQIGVTAINPGNVGTPEVLADLAADNLLGGEAIPLTDLLSIIDCILSLSRATCSNSKLIRYLLLFALGWAIVQLLAYFETIIVTFYLVFILIGLPYALVLAAIAGLFDLIPGIGIQVTNVQPMIMQVSRLG